ncbi:MAG: radical SAM protein [archaeon]
MSRILLVDPPMHRFMGYRRFYYPLSLAYIAGYLDKLGHKTRIYDADFDPKAVSMNRREQIKNYPKYIEEIKNFSHKVWNEMQRVIKKSNPDLIGITMISSKNQSAYLTARIAKEINPEIKIIVGGPHASALPFEVIKHPEIDFVVKGEGEITCGGLAEKIENRENDFHSVDGLYWKNDGEIIANKKRKFIEDLDELPFTFRELIINKEKYTPRDFGLMMTVRGCPYNCSYCASRVVWNGTLRFRSVGNIIEEIKHVKEKFSTTHIYIEDDNFLMPRKRVREFCEAMKREKLDVTWECQERATNIDEEICRTIKNAGCVSVGVGIESGNNEILKQCKKGVTKQEMRRASKIFKKIALPWKGFVMIGLPMETKNNVLETLQFMKELNPSHTSMHIFTPFPGTKFYSLYNLKEEDFYLYEPESPFNHFSFKMTEQEFNEVRDVMTKEIAELNEKNKEVVERTNVFRWAKNEKQN